MKRIYIPHTGLRGGTQGLEKRSYKPCVVGPIPIRPTEKNMVSVAKLVDAADCGSAGRNPM